MSDKIDYKDAGVDVEKTDAFVETLKTMVTKTFNPSVEQGIGGFAGLYKIDENKSLVAATDGVGTKLMLAIQTEIYDTVGIDLVAMCVNDLICVGATPLFFLDYYATGKFEAKVSKEILSGIVEGCLQSQMALLGGETAEMPGMYPDGKLDLAGFAVGMVSNDERFVHDFEDEDCLISIHSSGFHSNGYSLVRKVLKDDEFDLKRELLTPTKIYVDSVLRLRKKLGSSFKGVSNITGGGIHNIPRMSQKFDYNLTDLPSDSDRPEVMNEIARRTGLNKLELYETFNMGIGMVAVVKKDQCEEALNYLNSELQTPASYLGNVSSGSGKVLLD
ncbi:MAG: phosphoribosylformylglycinamidine cyclo-ligase [Bacteriovoracaceae bacterium]